MKLRVIRETKLLHLTLNTNTIEWGEAKTYKKSIWSTRFYDDYRYIINRVTKDILDILVS